MEELKVLATMYTSGDILLLLAIAVGFWFYVKWLRENDGGGYAPPPDNSDERDIDDIDLSGW